MTKAISFTIILYFHASFKVKINRVHDNKMITDFTARNKIYNS